MTRNMNAYPNHGQADGESRVTPERIEQMIGKLGEFIDQSMGIWVETLESVEHKKGNLLAPVKVLMAFAELNRNIRVNALIQTLNWGKDYENAVIRFNNHLEFAKVRTRGFDANRGMESLVDPIFPMQYRNTLMDDLELLRDDLMLIYALNEKLNLT